MRKELESIFLTDDPNKSNSLLRLENTQIKIKIKVCNLGIRKWFVSNHNLSSTCFFSFIAHYFPAHLLHLIFFHQYYWCSNCMLGPVLGAGNDSGEIRQVICSHRICV